MQWPIANIQLQRKLHFSKCFDLTISLLSASLETRFSCLLFIHELIPSKQWVILIIEVTRNRQLNKVKLIIQKETKRAIIIIKSASSLKARLHIFFAHLKNAGNYFPWILQDQVCHWLKLCLLKWKSRTLMSLIVLQARYFQWDC